MITRYNIAKRERKKLLIIAEEYNKISKAKKHTQERKDKVKELKKQYYKVRRLENITF